MIDNDWTMRYLAPLVGGTVRSVGVTPDGCPVIVVANGARHFVLTVARDSDGNGPGFVFGLPAPAPQKKKEVL